MKQFAFLIGTFLINLAYTQAPAIEWQNTIGGSESDWMNSVQQTFDGGYIIGGASQSGISGDKTESLAGDFDYWVLKLNSIGEIEWQNTIQGSGPDELYCVQQTFDGGYILAGFSYSGASLDKTEPIYGDTDYWVVKLDSEGEIEWQNSIGGNGVDQLFTVRQTVDGGYILGGESNSPISVDKTENNFGTYSTSDFWIIKLDEFGEIEWENTIGGTTYEHLYSVEQTVDGGYIVGGTSSSPISGDKTEASLGYSDYWILKLNSIGEIEWQEVIGGSDGDYLYTAKQTIEGGYILGGRSYSDISGDKTENNQGESDYWVVKLSSVGSIEWQNTIGGDGSDELYSVDLTTDGGYILNGISFSNISGDQIENCHSIDMWVVKINSTGSIVWQNAIGGDGWELVESPNAVKQTTDGGYILACTSESLISYDKTENSPSFDYWIVKLFPEECNIPSGLFVNNITATHAKLNWSSVSGAEKYQVFFKKITDATYTKLSHDVNYKNLSSLTPNTTYEYKVRAKCGDEHTEFSEIETFTTLSLRNGELESQVSIYPNPSTNTITLSVNITSSIDFSSPACADASAGRLIITDLSGKILSELSITSPETTIDVSNFAAGIYFIRLNMEGNSFTGKFVVE